MRGLIASIAILGLVGLAVGVSAQAVTEAPVLATVTAQLIAVSVLNGTVDYGILSVSTSKNTISPSQTQTATNDSNVTAKLNIKSSDAVGGVNWDLAATAAADAFTHEFSVDGGTNWTAFSPDNITYSTLNASVAAGGTQAFDIRIGTPISVSDNVQKTITVTVQATTP